MADPVTLGINQFKWLNDADTRALTLYNADTADASPMSMYESQIHSRYDIPVGKKFIILKVQASYSVPASGQQVIYSGGTDTATNTLVKFRVGGSGGSDALGAPPVILDTYIEVPYDATEKTIVCDLSTTSGVAVMIVGVETDI